MLGFAPLEMHVTRVLEVKLMVPRHLGAATFGILALAGTEIVVLTDEMPEVVTLHISGIGITIYLSIVGKVPAIELFTRGWHVDEVAWSGGVTVYIAAEGVGIATERSPFILLLKV